MRSSGSVGANYIEANEALSKKDFVHSVKIAKKETKETAYWLEIISDYDNCGQVRKLLNEAIEINKILSATILKSK